LAFTIGFGVFFFAMILFTLAYAGPVILRLNEMDRLPDVFFWWLQIHLAAQLAFTIGVHWAGGTKLVDPPSHQRTFGFLLGTIACGFAANYVTRFIRLKLDYEPGEFIYRLFMAFYGLVFPAY